VQLEAIRSMFDEMGGIQKVLADLTIVHDWVNRLEQLRQQMYSFERCSQTAEQKYLDVQHIMENRHEIKSELHQALHSSKEIRKDCQKLKDEVDAKHQCLQKQIRGLQKEIEVLKLATTPQKNRKNRK
jgi:predicted  nucleic acid-binding Zn-ribbon protein